LARPKNRVVICRVNAEERRTEQGEDLEWFAAIWSGSVEGLQARS
jgi:hypothetical protein